MNAILYPNPPKIRRVTSADADFVFGLAQACYHRTLDRAGCQAWFDQCMAMGDVVFFCRGVSSVGVAMQARSFYDPGAIEAHMVYLMAQPNRGLEGYHMLKAMVDWAKSLPAPLHMGSTSLYDLSAFAKRLGAKPHQPSWVVPL